MQTILLLHGAIGASDQMGPLAAELAKAKMEAAMITIFFILFVFVWLVCYLFV